VIEQRAVTLLEGIAQRTNSPRAAMILVTNTVQLGW